MKRLLLALLFVGLVLAIIVCVWLAVNSGRQVCTNEGKVRLLEQEVSTLKQQLELYGPGEWVEAEGRLSVYCVSVGTRMRYELLVQEKGSRHSIGYWFTGDKLPVRAIYPDSYGGLRVVQGTMEELFINDLNGQLKRVTARLSPDDLLLYIEVRPN